MKKGILLVGLLVLGVSLLVRCYQKPQRVEPEKKELVITEQMVPLETNPEEGSRTSEVPTAALTPRIITIKGITRANVGQKITLRGSILGHIGFRGADDRVFEINDSTGTIDVLVWNDLYEQIPQRTFFIQGTSIEVHGVIEIYLSKLQIRVTAPEDIKVLDFASDSISKVNNLSNITAGLTGQRRTVEGIIIDTKIFWGMRGRTLKISDGTGTIDVLIWDKLGDRIPQRDSLIKGTKIQVSGKIGSYKGHLQIEPEEPGDIQVLGAPLVVGVTSINSITQASINQVVTLKGSIISVRIFEKETGRTLKVNDGTGTIEVLVWKDLYQQLPRREFLIKGSKMQVSGKIGSYKGRLQIQPEEPGDIHILVAVTPNPF